MYTMENLVKVLCKRSSKEIIKLLWLLCCSPEVLEEYDLNENEKDAKVFREYLLKEYKENHKDFHFADGETKLETYGFDLGINEPIVRDYLILACQNVSESPSNLRTCISNICTRKNLNDLFTYNERRKRAFKALGFNSDEMNYLENTIDTYNIGEFLKILQKNLYPETISSINKSNYCHIDLLNQKNKIQKDVPDKAVIVLSNPKIILNYLNASSELKKIGVDSNYIEDNRENIMKLLDISESLN